MSGKMLMDRMRKRLILSAVATALLLVRTSGAADTTTQTRQTEPLTPEVAKGIQKDPYIDESVQTTNGNVVGLFTRTIFDKEGRPVLGVMRAYENVGRSRDFIALPWPLLRFDKQNRRIEVASAGGQIRNAPRFTQEQFGRLDDPAEINRIYQHFGVATGGGAVAATMGTQSGQGSSASFPPPPTNEAEPRRGSVSVMYIAAVLALIALGIGYFVRRRA
jgi:hypothetical protein